MDDLRELYQETILDHKKNPRNFGELENPSHTADGYNPLCGDKLTIHLNIDAEGQVGSVAHCRFGPLGVAPTQFGQTANVSNGVVKDLALHCGTGWGWLGLRFRVRF